MGHAQVANLIENQSDTTQGEWVGYVGGRSVLVVQATAYSTTFRLQYKGPDGNPIDVVANSTADSITAVDLPQGEYRMNVSGGSPSAMYAVISKVVY